MQNNNNSEQNVLYIKKENFIKAMKLVSNELNLLKISPYKIYEFFTARALDYINVQFRFNNLQMMRDSQLNFVKFGINFRDEFLKELEFSTDNDDTMFTTMKNDTDFKFITNLSDLQIKYQMQQDTNIAQRVDEEQQLAFENKKKALNLQYKNSIEKAKANPTELKFKTKQIEEKSKLTLDEIKSIVDMVVAEHEAFIAKVIGTQEVKN